MQGNPGRVGEEGSGGTVRAQRGSGVGNLRALIYLRGGPSLDRDWREPSG